MQHWLDSGCCLLVEAQPFFSSLHVDVKTPFLIASDDAVKKSLLVAMGGLVTSEQTGGNSGALKFVAFGQNVWHACTKFLDFSH